MMVDDGKFRSIYAKLTHDNAAPQYKITRFDEDGNKAEARGGRKDAAKYLGYKIVRVDGNPIW